jgi:hypothetical protein
VRIVRSLKSYRNSIFDCIHSALKGLHTTAHGQRQSRATLGRNARHEVENPSGVPHRYPTLCNPFRVGDVKCNYVPGWRYAAGRLRLPWAMVWNAFGVNGRTVAILFAVALTFCFGICLPARAEVIIIEREDPSLLTIYVMTVTPAPEPKPALKYHFLVPPVDRIHANAATLYYKAETHAEEGTAFRRFMEMQNNDEKYEMLYSGPLNKLPQKEVEEYVGWFAQSFLPSVREAGKCDYCNWMDDIRGHGISTLLPQAQASRSDCQLLSLIARLQIAQGKFDDAIETLSAGYAWSRNLGHSPTLVQCLIGMAFQGLLNQQTCTLIGQENSPNLYWALTDLAAEPIDLREALSYEQKIWEFSVHSVEDLDRRVLTAEEANKLAEEITHIATPNLATTLLWAVQLEPQARKYLLEHGYTAEKLDVMPVLQLALLYRWKQFGVVRDDCFKFLLLPDGQSFDSAARSDQAVRAAYARGEGTPFTNLLPAIHAASYARLRTMRHVNLLRTVEALRMYAAERGRWPEKLDDIKAVPVPNDPYTEKPFEYSLKDGVAILHTTTDGLGSSTASGPQRFELTLKKSETK